MNKDLFVGIDGGGTWTRALIIDAEGHVVGFGKAGSSNRNHHSEEEVAANLRSAILAAVGSSDLSLVRRYMMGMAGVSTDSDRESLRKLTYTIPEVMPGTPIDIENDTYTGLVGGLSCRPGMVLIAGTGSIVFGRNNAGQTHMCGGWGALADDAGSAYAVSVEAIRIAVRVEDGRLQDSKLHSVVLKFLGIEAQPRDLIDRVHNQGLGREDIAQMAPLVMQAAREGDWAADQIVKQQVEELVGCVRGVNKRLFPAGESAELVYVGGLALSGDPYQTRLTARIQESCPNVRVVPSELSAERGAALEALRRSGVSVTPTVLTNLGS